MNKNKLILPISILLGCIILGGFFYVSQINKQRSIEKQQQIELQAKSEQDKAKMEADKAQQNAIKQAEEINKQMLSDCLKKAEKEYTSAGNTKCLFAGYTQEQINDNKCFISMTQNEIDSIDKTLQTNKDNCYKQYK